MAQSSPSNLNALLSDIYVRYVQIRDYDFQLHYRVIDRFFHNLHQKMSEVDLYYRRYSSTVQFGGSHYDNVRIVKPDEFDMTIVIGLPVSPNANSVDPAQSDIVIEPKAAGFVQLKMGTQFQNLPKNVAEWANNRAAYNWMDTKKYLLRSEFIDWFKSVVSKALNTFELKSQQPLFYVDGVPYVVRKSESGPAMTLFIENKERGFKLDVDLVPALKFPESRWPVGPAYRRTPPQCARGDWMLVAKSIKNDNQHDVARSWRIARPNQERQLIENTGNMRQAWRLTKKLRDSLGMHKIASYFIKNLFFREIVEKIESNDTNFWHRNNPASLFKLMMGKFYAALTNKKIPYFWNKNENLLARVADSTLVEYAAKLKPLLKVLEDDREYKQVAKFLLTAQEFKDYNAKFLHI